MTILLLLFLCSVLVGVQFLGPRILMGKSYHRSIAYNGALFQDDSR